jgi:hypothetical protein
MIATIAPSQTNVAGAGHIDDRQSVVRERDAADDRVAGDVWTRDAAGYRSVVTVWQDQGAGAPLEYQSSHAARRAETSLRPLRAPYKGSMMLP